MRILRTLGVFFLALGLGVFAFTYSANMIAVGLRAALALSGNNLFIMAFGLLLFEYSRLRDFESHTRA